MTIDEKETANKNCNEWKQIFLIGHGKSKSVKVIYSNSTKLLLYLLDELIFFFLSRRITA